MSAKIKSLDAILKEQCQEIFDTFFGSQKSTWAPYEQANTSFEKIFVKNVCPCSQRLR